METLEKLRNGIDQLPKWLLLVLVIFVDGLVGGLYRAAGKTKHRADVLLNQAFNQNRRSVEFHLNRSLLLIVKKAASRPALGRKAAFAVPPKFRACARSLSTHIMLVSP